MIRVYSHNDSPRLRYVLNFLSEYFGRPFVRAENAADAELHYGHDAPARLSIGSSGLLFEEGIRAFDPVVATHAAGFPVLFPDGGPLGFDVFSAVFFLLTRYEEYGTHSKDSYGRYAHTNSLAFRHGFLREPLVHRWLDLLAQRLFGAPFFPPFRFVPTYDIDMAWSYRHKGFMRNAGGLLRSLWRRDGTARGRLSVLLQGARDPFDCYDFLDGLHERLSIRPHYFIHAGTGRNAFDKNVSISRPAMQQLLRRLSRSSTIGLHPSWASGDRPELIAIEKKALEKTLHAAVICSRQHFIRFTLPQTFRQLIAAGIPGDYSMGYGTINGFRASVAVPYYWYDLGREEPTALRLHPFCFMDANALFEQKQDVAQTAAELASCLETFRRWGGTFVSVWHNSYLGAAPEYAGWPEIHARFLEQGSAARNADSL